MELLVLSALPATAGLAFPSIAGTGLVAALPYALVFPVVAALRGLGWAMLAGSVAIAAGLVVRLTVFKAAAASFFVMPAAGTLVVALLTVSLTLAVSFIRSYLVHSRTTMLQRLRASVHEAGELRRKNMVLEKVNRVLESRVSSQKDSITFLHDQVRKLATLSLDQALDTILETVAMFTELGSGSIWKFDDDKHGLVPAAVFGWSASAPAASAPSSVEDQAPRSSAWDATLDLDTTVEGYVLRNRKMFSVRMLLEGSEFDRFSTDRNLITLPVVIGSKVWGVLNIEDLPFERYSQYTETILAIILSLSEPYLRRIIEYETLNDQNEIDPDTGYPLFSILYRTLESDLERISLEPGFVSLIVLEIINYTDLSALWSKDDLRHMFVAMKNDIDKLKRMKVKVFHFKEENQLVLLAYDLDQDGTSFFCLDILSMFSEYRFSIGDTTVPIELVIGFSSSAQSGSSADNMIAAAEHLLSVQRI